MSFQPFVVPCLTCGSQLRVTDPAIVGTIATCPKCHSMVQIEQPGHQVAVGGSSVDSQAITEEAIAANEGATLGSAPPDATGFAGAEGQRQPPAGAAVRSAEPPPWQSDRTQRSRQIALVVAISLTGLLVAIAGFSWFVRSWHDRVPVTQSNEGNRPDPMRADEAGGNDDVVDDPDSTLSTPVGSEPHSNDPPNVDPAEPSTTSESNDTVKDSLDAIPDDSATPVPATGPEEASPSNANPSSAPTDASMARPETTPSRDATAALSDLIPRSPLDPAPPAVPSPPQPQPPKDQDTATAESGGLQELPPELAKYTKFLLQEGSPEKPNLEAPPTMDEITIEAAAEELDDPTLTVRPKEINLKADMAVRLAVDTKGYPLPDLVLLISQITGVPIQIDWVSFDLAGIDLQAPLTAPQGWQTAREMLEAVVTVLGAELREEETLIVVTLTDDVFAERLGELLDLSDFGDGEASAKQVLIEFLRSEGDEPGNEIPIGVSREDQQIAAIAADALRRMRGVPPKVDQQRLHRWAWCSNDPTGEWTPVSGGDAGTQSGMPLAMADFLRRMAQRNDTSNLINWYDFNRRAVAPERLLIPHREEDAGKTLQRVLKPLGLQARQVDDKHWWFGLESTYDRLPVVVWTPPLGPQREPFISELSDIMEGASRDIFRINHDPESDRVLMLLPRFIVRQLTKLADGVAGRAEDGARM